MKVPYILEFLCPYADYAYKTDVIRKNKVNDNYGQNGVRYGSRFYESFYTIS